MPLPTSTPVGTATAGTYYFLDREIEAAGRAYNAGVLDGLGVTAAATPSLVLHVEAGTFHQGGSDEPDRVFAGGTVTASAADTEFIRADLVSIFWNGTAAQLVVTPGLANDNSNPSPPSIPLSYGSVRNVVLATVMVYPTAFGGSGIPDDLIYDRRFFLPFQFSGPSRTLATSNTTGAFVEHNELVVWTDLGNVQGSGGRTLDTVGDVISNAIGPVDGQVALYSVGGPTAAISNATATGRPLLTTGVLSVAPINLASEVTGDLPFANLAPASAASRLLLRGAASGAGDWQEGTLGSGLSLAGTVLSASGGSGGPFASAQGSYNTDLTERDLLSFTVPGNTLGASGGILFFISGRILSNSGVNAWTLRVKFGATTLMGDQTANFTNNGSGRAVVMWGMLYNVGNTAIQRAEIDGTMGGTAAGSIAGTMDIAVANTATMAYIIGQGGATEDTTADKVFAVTGQFVISNVLVDINWKAVAYLI